MLSSVTVYHHIITNIKKISMLRKKKKSKNILEKTNKKIIHLYIYLYNQASQTTNFVLVFLIRHSF